ncbi:MAG: hypothetical protein V7L29_24110 [Nostoc sp.]|uniref:hypothetical protein n=1 Tax=Nostoc sp. TaxID=1180 RepID=UPI002FEFC963
MRCLRRAAPTLKFVVAVAVEDRTYRIVDYVRRESGTAGQLDECYIRWSVIAEVDKDYLALSWDGFTYSLTADEHIEQRTQFPFWNHIPGFLIN